MSFNLWILLRAKVFLTADGAFGETFKESGKVLASKNENAEQYSKNMAEKAGATNTLDENMAAIHEFVKGKTVAELEETT